MFYKKVMNYICKNKFRAIIKAKKKIYKKNG